MKPVVFIAVSHGMHVRNLLNSSIFHSLKKDYDIVLLTFAADVPFAEAAYGSDCIAVLPFVSKLCRYENTIEFIRRYVITNAKRNRTINIFSMVFQRKRPILYGVLKSVNRVLGKFRCVRSAWLKFEERVVTGKEYDSYFVEYRPALLLAANYGTLPDEVRILRAAKRAHVPSVSVVPSWDNLVSKGVIASPPDKMIVWNEIMRTEAIELHDYEKGDVETGGGVQFDVYGDRKSYLSRKDTCAVLGLNPLKKYVVYGTITPQYFKYNIRTIEMLAEASRNGEFGEPVQVLVRVHPQVVDDARYGDRLEDYKRLVDAFPDIVVLNIPRIERWAVLKPPHHDDGRLLGMILHYAEACVVPGSTLALDAIANDTPAIGVGFDGDVVQPYEESIRRWYDFTYFQPLMEMHGIDVAYSSDQMVALVKSAVKDKSAGAAIRKAVVARYLGKLDGRCGEHIVEVVRALTGK